VELEEFAVSLADLLFEVTLPKISGEAIGAVRLLAEGDVVMSLELDYVVAFGSILIVPSGFSVGNEADAKFLTRKPKGLDVFDLRFNFGEVTHCI